jgi:hypothetical protein
MIRIHFVVKILIIDCDPLIGRILDAGFWMLGFKGNNPFYIQHQVSRIFTLMARTLISKTFSFLVPAWPGQN